MDLNEKGELEQLIEKLRDLDCSVVVTGPQRSGTTIVARILAHELKFRYVDEDQIGVEDFHRALAILKGGDSIVMQAPALCYLAERLPAAIVVVKRPVDEIVASEQRIGWPRADHELQKYRATTKDGPIALIKYREWFLRQKDLCSNPFELNYSAIEGHKLFVEKKDRRNFRKRQWRRS